MLEAGWCWPTGTPGTEFGGAYPVASAGAGHLRGAVRRKQNPLQSPAFPRLNAQFRLDNIIGQSESFG